MSLPFHPGVLTSPVPTASAESITICMKRIFLFLLLALALRAQATHNVAGEITVRCLGGLQYEATITTFTSSADPNAPDRCSLVVDWGDGFRQTAYRSGGNMASLCTPPVTGGFNLHPAYPYMQKNTYIARHTYSGGSTYLIKVADPNRVGGIDNLANSVNSPFCLMTRLSVAPFAEGCNSTPTLAAIPLDKACVGHCFYHNPGAYDPEGDSLSYSIGPILDTMGNPVAGGIFVMPGTPCTSSIPHGGGGTMSIDPISGDLSWCAPTCQGKFNVGLYVHEWRSPLGGGPKYQASLVYREMQIDVATCNNSNPTIPPLPDLCVDAGTNVNFNFTVTDPDAGDSLQLSLYGSVTSILPAATLTPTAMQTAPVTATFDWSTSCEHVRLQPHTVTVKARDNDPMVPLTDIETFNITVVSPGPATLTAAPSGTSMLLNWSVNPCDPSGNHCDGYRIYRRAGPSNWNPVQCETGVPSYTGFVYIGSVAGLNNTSFVDDNNGAGLTAGVNYCYRVHAYFRDGAKSYASPEACNALKRDVPVIEHVDVVSTGTNDTIGISWYNPIADASNFDTLQYPGPYALKIYRSQGHSLGAPAHIATLTSTHFAALPDSFTDVSLQTAAAPYCYRIAFFSGTDSIGATQPASSVFLQSIASDNTVSLSWNEDVPWSNVLYEVYRKNPSASNYTLLATTPQRAYTDNGLVNGEQYCYYVRSLGSYFNPSLPDTTKNRSQRVCAVPVDLTPPCPPQLNVTSDCYEHFNLLNWLNPVHLGCGTDDVVSYHVWFTPTSGGSWQLLAAIGNANDTSLAQLDLSSVAGCYAITALDTFNNESAFSNMVCVDNCPEYNLPNVFTPNGDGSNDLLIPFPYQYIESVEFKIFDRWGVLIFETNDPSLKWDGRSAANNRLCSDGVYYYVCTVNEIRLQGVVPRQLTGFFHLFGQDKDGPK